MGSGAPSGSHRHRSHGSSSKEGKDKKNKTKTTHVWYCCHCNRGPLNVDIDDYCPYHECGYQRCENCTYDSFKQPKS
ncbi:hypothetical protein MCOR06_005144 [Pyricularia oryzae]|nr:hypothetical protein MCOR06_005144 [Pyricularia oryzae]